LGTLAIQSLNKPKKNEKIEKLEQEDFYDEYKMDMTELKALLSPATENWRSLEVTT